VLCVAGAGRGPLVARALEAIKRAKRTDVAVFAVEKNPSAYVTCALPPAPASPRAADGP
jgi:protein arginine N-methyltransferase 5